ncbi:hypothetical protein [Limnoglobus roseus]|uniref:HEAT repeat domain-containing protein n=1 Tax=Limnoglobus roseus TaxID=2598579 RepID=A0A5C1AP54_9BACT|nr:hypothetical protein [Limnoglobus roseus]QEL19923.1 hypothetical protein PX52LOC_07005 [Limnoglobus roseus]
MSQTSLLLVAAGVAMMATHAVAAPVPPANPEAKKKELEALWADLAKDEPVASRAVLKLFAQPEHAVPFLKANLGPLKLDADRCKRLLKDLGSGDEKTWRAAWAELDYLDPRLAIDLPTLMKDVTENPARSRMVELFSNRTADSMRGEALQLEAIGDGEYNFVLKGGGQGERI